MIEVRAVGDRAALVTLGSEISPTVLARVLAFDRALAAGRPPGIVETVPAYASLLAILDPRAPVAEVCEALRSVSPAGAPDLSGRALEVPVAYGGVHGPDLDDVAERSGLAPSEVIDRHSGREYLVYQLGFAPGFAYMGTLPEDLAAPRLASPRTRVPAGSVGVAGRQTGVYPFETPGGWRIIGRTPLVTFDPMRDQPATFAAGDRVRFAPIEHVRFARREPRPPQPPLAERPALVVRDGGLFATVQDLGRSGYRRIGVPPSGAMDPSSLGLANALVGNAGGAAAIECTFPGPVLVALRDLECAIAGAGGGAEVDGAPAPLGRAFVLRRGQALAFRRPDDGVWAYVAVRGGVDVPAVMGSRATYVRASLGGFAGRRLGRGDVVGAGETTPGGGMSEPFDAARDASDRAVRIVPGPHVDAFPAASLDALLRTPYAVSARSDRAGHRLDGPAIPPPPGERISEGIVPGAIQVTPSGAVIVVMPDGPTVGGYPVLAVVTGGDLARVAQTAPGRRLTFALHPSG